MDGEHDEIKTRLGLEYDAAFPLRRKIFFECCSRACFSTNFLSQIVYRNVSDPSMTLRPLSACRLACTNHPLSASTNTTTKQLHLSPIKHIVSKSLHPGSKASHSRNSRTDPRYVSRGILRPEDRPSADPTNAPKGYKHGAAQCAFPLAADVVGLVCQRGGDVGVRTGGDEEDAEVASAAGGGESHDGEADEGDEGVGD